MKELFTQVLDNFAPILKKRQYVKGQLLHWEEELSYKIYLVRQGIIRSFYYVEERDITAHFAMEYGIIGAADSIIKNQKSRYFIEVLAKSEVYQFDYLEMESYLLKNPELERLARQFSQMIYIDLVERFEGMMFLSAKDRYLHFIDRYPGLINRVNLGHVASYLGITQETLSRVRKTCEF